jgi:hypothetical protein
LQSVCENFFSANIAAKDPRADGVEQAFRKACGNAAIESGFSR